MTALDVRGLEKSFGGLRVTAGVSLTVEAGERRLIIGPNGAGKTTLFNLITGELRPDRGSIALFDRDITRVPGRRRPHLGIARTYQIITLFTGETLLHNVTLSLLGLRRLRWNPLVRLGRQQALIAEARAALEAAEAEQRRAERLLAERAVPARRVEDAARALAVARAQFDAAETRLAQRDQTLRSGGAAAGGNTFDVRAPIAGTVVAVFATPGAAYEEGAELFRIVRTDPVGVEVHVPPSAADVRAPVTDVALELPDANSPVQARILRQGHAGVVDAKLRALVLRFEVANSDGRLLVGQAGTAVLYLNARTNLPVVPVTAILTEAGRPFLFVQQGGESFEKRMVELGARDGGRVAVTAGVKPGERVVTRGAYDVQLASAAKGLPAEGHVH